MPCPGADAGKRRRERDLGTFVPVELRDQPGEMPIDVGDQVVLAQFLK